MKIQQPRSECIVVGAGSAVRGALGCRIAAAAVLAASATSSVSELQKMRVRNEN